LPGLELKGAARDVAAALRFARGRAIATRNEVALVIDVEAGKYHLEGTSDDRETSLGQNTEIRLLTGRSELRSENVGAISFFPDGSSTGGQITLSRGDRAFKVDVLWITGKVTIVDG
jgi:general secretion pathway protein H